MPTPPPQPKLTQDQASPHGYAALQQPPPPPPAAESPRRFSLPFDPNHIILLMTAAVTAFGALTAYLQIHANAQASRYNRDGQVQAVLSLQDDIAANLLYNFETNRLRNFAELNNTSALYEIYGDEEKSAQLAAAAEALITESALFVDPYYDPESGFFPDLNAFYYDTVSRPYYVARETRAALVVIGDAWLNKGNAYQTIITLTAVTLFLFGLSLTLDGCIKFGFVGLGSVNLAFIGVWLLVTVLTPVPTMPTEAIERYADGEVHVSKAFNLEYWSDYEAVPDEAAIAIDTLTEAIRLHPGFEVAYVARADAWLVIGESYLLAGGNAAEAEDALLAAVEDYQAAIALQPENYHTHWNLGWTLYLLGEFDEALTTFDEVLRLAPEQQFGANIDRAMNLLGLGRRDEAIEVVYNAILQAAQRPSSDDIYYYRQSIRNLSRFGAIFEHDGMNEMQTMLKEAFVSVQNRGEPEPGDTVAQISALTFTDSFSGESGNVFPSGVEQINVQFSHSGLQTGEQVLMKVVRDDSEQAYMKQVIYWDGPADGAANRFSIQEGVEQRYNPLASGTYEIEIYVEGNLMFLAEFEITP